MLRPLLLGAFLGTTPAVHVSEEVAGVDASAVRRGLEVRLADAVDGWSIDVQPTQGSDALWVRLRSPTGTELHRTITLEGEQHEERSRELAAAVALIIEGHVESEAVPRAPQAPPARARGWIGLGPRIGLGPPAALQADYGLSVRGGAWLVREHVQPLLSFGWSRSTEGQLVLDGVRFGVGAAFGMPLLGRRLWVGAGAIPHAAWTRAMDRSDAAQWRSSTEIAALVQTRGRWWLLGLRSGVELTLPPVRAVGQDATIRWGAARFVIGLDFGLILPPRN